MIRSPICVFVGHVDHGKSSILDKIRGTAIVQSEPGGITQCISSTSVSIDTIKKITGNLLEQLKIKLTIPGLLFIDTPGHAAFSNLRKRGGNLADIAVLVIDINEGIREQTIECIEILKNYKTPFLIAANKIDLISGWRNNNITLLENIKKQSSNVQENLDKKLYELVGRLSEFNFNSERYDRVEDYTKQIAIVPLSAKSGEGIPELLMVLTGLAQRYLEQSLKINVEGQAKGIVLEVKEQRGLGTILDAIIYDGTLKINDTIIIGSLNEPIVTKVRALIEPSGSIKEVHAASGVRISAPNLKDVYGGMPFSVANKDLEKIKQEIQKEVEEVILDVDNEGIIIKADTLGSLEALIGLLKDKNILIKKASMGDISKKDIAEASAEKDPLNKIILGFNIKPIEASNIKQITNDVIYKIIDEYEVWVKEQKQELEKKELEDVTKPCKLKILRGCIFRQSHPAVVGVVVLNGTLKAGIELMKENTNKIGKVKSIQLEKENISEAIKGQEIAIALPNVTAGRQINEDDILYSNLNEQEFVKLKKLKKYLNSDEIEVLKEIAEIKRKENPLWGV
ncbi:MAG: translation initiation factor IF-2 [Candidatus Woesearchaeota archaeon]|nr:translation initiation factor IF-2 [Candidatus Woesearchaeota archaeon]